MPSDATLDLDEIGRAAGAFDNLDLAAIGRAAPADDLIQRERLKESLRQQRNLAAVEGSRAGALADVIRSVAEPAVEAAHNFPANLFNIPSLITGSHPLVAPGQPIVHVPIDTEDIRRAIVQNPYLAGSILGASPELTAGVTRGGLDVAESFTTPENLILLGALPKAAPSVQRPVTAAFAAQMGLDVPEAARRLGEATVTEPTMEQIRQATALGVNIALPTQMAVHPEMAARRASDAEAIRLEGTRLRDYFAQQREQERATQQAAEEQRLLGSDPLRRIAIETARQQGIPVGEKRSGESHPGTAIPSAQADLTKPLVDRPAAAIQLPSDLVDALSRANSLDQVNIVGKNPHVVASVLSGISDSQILDSVIKSIPVDVVNELIGPEFSSKPLLDQKAMLVNFLAVDRNAPVPAPVVRVIDAIYPLLQDRTMSILASSGAVPPLPRRIITEYLSAKQAGEVGHAVSISKLPAEASSKEGGQNAIPIEGSTTIPVRETPVGGQAVGAEIRRAEELAGAVAQAGPRGGGVAGETGPLPEAKEGDIVELHGYVGQYTADENGKPIIKLEGNRFVEVNEPVTLRLTVTQDGKIARNGILYEPAIGAGKPWRNAYNQATGRLKIRRVDGTGGVTYLIGPSSDYIVTRLNELYPPKPLAKPSKVQRLTEEETTTGVLPGESENVDTPVDEFILKVGLDKELAENKAARMEVKNNVSVDLPEFSLERMRRHPAPQPHSGDIKPARMLYNPSGAHAGYLIFQRGPHYSYRIPLAELPAGSWGKLPGGAWFDKRAILAFLSNNERRFANRNTSGENEYFTPQDIDAIRGVTGKPGRPRTAIVGNVSLDQPAGEKGTIGDILTAEPRYVGRMTGIVKRTFDNLLKDQPELFNDLLEKPVEQLDEAFWGRVREAIAAQDEFKIDPKGAITTQEKQTQAIDLMLNNLRMRKETPGGFGEQASLAHKGWEGIEGEPQRAAQEAANLQEARKLVDDPNNGLSEEARAVLRDILDSPIAAYLNGRQIRFRLVDQMERPLAAYYSPAEQLIAVARNRDPFAGAHEFFHPLWEMIQDFDRANIKRWRDQAIAKALETATGKDLKDLRKLAAGELGYRQFYDAGIDNKFYNWSSAEEFFAHMMTDRFARDRQGIWGQVKDVLASQDAFLAKVREILAVIFDAIRQRVPGLRTQADALQKRILSGKYDVLPASENIPGRRLVTSNAVVTAPGVGPSAAITAHHGTPHEISDRFSTQRIGTGQGAQTYGWGIYFAEHPEVAKDYAETLARGKVEYYVRGLTPDAQQRLGEIEKAWPRVLEDISKMYEPMTSQEGNRTMLARELRDIADYTTDLNDMASKAYRDLAKEFEDGTVKVDYRYLGGNEYTVRLDVNPEDLLDWDKPMNQQSPKVQQALLKDFGSQMGDPSWRKTGSDIYDILRERFATERQFGGGWRWQVPDSQLASAYLNSIGIPGIRYLDQGSRRLTAYLDSATGRWHAGDTGQTFATQAEAQAALARTQTYNFVIFDDKLIHITHRNGQEIPLQEAMGKPREAQGMLESPEKVEEYITPLEPITTPERFRSMAAVLNKNMIPPPAAERFGALPEGVRGELGSVFPGRIATYRERPDAPSFRQVMANESLTPDERSDYARHAFDELRQYQTDKRNVLDQLDTVTGDLDQAITKAVEIIPKTNEAELLATTLIGNVLDRIKAERERTAEGAQANARIQGGIQHIDAFNELLSQPVPLANAMRGIANIVGRAALTAARPGGDVLELIGQRSGFEGGIFEQGTNQWIQALAAHLYRLETPEGNRVINASEDIIRSTLHALNQLGDARQALHEFQLSDDGTLRRFRADYLEDLRSRTPRGFNAILRRYATAQVEADALTSAQRRLDRKIDTLTTRKANLERARDFLAEHDRDPAFMDFGKAVVQFTGGEQIELTRDGTSVTYLHPLTGKLITIKETFREGGSPENLRKMQELADAGLQYAAQPGADPLKVAFWLDFAENVSNSLLVASPYYDVLADPAWNVLKKINNMAPFMIAETQLSRIPGFGAARATRALHAMAPAVKAKNAFQKDFENHLVAANIDAWKSHKNIGSLQQWQEEVASPIHDQRQHFGQNEYRVGDTISGYGHVITPEDMKAVRLQTHADHVLVALHQRAMSAAIAEAPQKVKIGQNLRRFALTRGPGTISRLLPRTTRDIPEQWFEAIRRRPEERRGEETEANAGEAAAAERLDTFLGTDHNFFRLVLKHVLEDERDYGQLGKGPLAGDFKALRLDERELAAAGRLPNNLADLSDWIAAHHNEHLRENEPPITAADVRNELITEVSDYMLKLQELVKEAPNRAKVDITSHENSFTQPREVKIVPGSLYEYGMADRIKANRMGNDAIEYYVVRWRDSLQELYNDLLRQKDSNSKVLKEVYGSESFKAGKELRKAIMSGEHQDRLGRYQLTSEEIDANIDRVGKMLQNSKELLTRRDEFYGDDIANRLFSPTTSFFAGNVLLSPATWILNGSSGSVMGALKVAEISRGGWLTAPPTVLKAHLRTVFKTILSKPPKNEQERIIQRLAADPVLQNGVIEMINDSNREFQDRQILRRAGVVDSFSYRDNLGMDRDLPMLRNIRNAIETIRNISAKPDPSLRKQIFSYLGVAPKAYTILTRAIGMRWGDNWINLQTTTLANGIAERLRLRAIKVFDKRLENDPRFAELYRQYGDSFQRFAVALVGEGEGGLLTPSEITGRSGPTARKAAVQLRRTFFRNNDPVDILMLKYWWNQKNANGDKNAPFMTQAQRSALQFGIAEDINMGTLATRSQWFSGSRLRQMLGILGQYWLWNTDKLSEIVAGVRGQKSYGRYLPHAMAFLITAGLVGLVAGQLSQQVTQQIYNTVSNKPAFWEATDDPQKLKIIVSNMANYLGMLGSVTKYFMDTPGKLGYRNPIFLQNIAMDFMDTAAKVFQTQDALNPTLDFFARYMPPLRVALNRSDMREGLMDIRNAANALRAATPDSMEAKRRQPTPGSDMRGTPMTPLYNAILNAAAAGDWGSADEAFARAVEQARAGGNANPEQAIISAIRTRAPESAVFSRRLTDEERDLVYSRLTPAGREAVDKANSVFEELASRYGGGGGGAGGGARASIGGGRGLSAGLSRATSLGGFGLGLGGGIGGRGTPSLAPRPVRYGLRSRSLARGRRTRNLLRPVLARPRVGRRLRRLAL